MPAKTPDLSTEVEARAQSLGSQIRLKRKALGVSATAVAESAGMSRVTLHRVERGEPSVTFGAYLALLDVLDITLRLDAAAGDAHQPSEQPDEGWLPLRIALADFPQLKRLAWQLSDVETLSPREALDIYDRNWRHLDVTKLTASERRLIDALKAVFNEGDRRV